jgi:hypothetical protein
MAWSSLHQDCQNRGQSCLDRLLFLDIEPGQLDVVSEEAASNMI